MILNFRIHQLDAKIFVDPEEVRKYRNININYDINIRNTTLLERSTVFGKKDVLRIDYAFSINYLSPNIGHLRFEGSAEYFSPGTDLAKLKSEWDSRRAPPEVQNEVANNIIVNLAPLAMTLSSSLGLPPSIPLPSLSFQKKKETRFTHYHG
jgi:hypothetical protein